MSSAHRGGGHMTGNSTATDTEVMQRVRYMAHMERRARPPTFRPLTIVVVVLSIGLFIIGLIMIVIAHWPGVSGGDSLKIAGGVLVAVGLKVFIIAMVTTCVLRNREQARFEKSMASIAVSRSNISHISRHNHTPQITPTPSIDAKPGKSILKKTPSTSTYGTNRGSVFGEESDSGVPYNNSFGQDSNQSSDGSAGKYEVYRIETLPDPGLAKRGRNGALPQGHNLSGSGLGNLSGSGAGLGVPGMGMSMEQSSTDSEAQVIPTAVRNTKKRRGQSPSVASGRQNLSYTPDSDAQEEKPRRQLQEYSHEGYDMYDRDQAAHRTRAAAPQLQAQPPHSRREHDTSTTDSVPSIPSAQRENKRRQRRAQKPAAPQGQPAAFQNEAFTPQEADLGYPPQQTTTTTTTTRHVTRHVTSQQHDTSHNTSRGSVDDELRINIKAQPGTAVHITPTGTRKYRAPRPVASPSQSSVETEI